MNVAQKTQTITRLPKFFAIHKIGGTHTDLQHAVQVNNMSSKILRYINIEKTPTEDFPDTNFDLRPAQEYVLLIIVSYTAIYFVIGSKLTRVFIAGIF